MLPAASVAVARKLCDASSATEAGSPGETSVALTGGGQDRRQPRTRRTSAAFGSPFEAVTPAKLARLRRLAARWIADRGVHVTEVRFDLVGVRLDLHGEERFEHVRGVG